MPRTAPPSAEPARRTPAQRASAVAALVSSGLALALAAAGVAALASGEPGPALPWLLASGLACAVLATGWTLWRQRTLEAALNGARTDAAALAELVDAWLWRSDAAGRLTLLRPTAAEDADATAIDAIGSPPWSFFAADDDAAATLRSRIESSLPVHGLVVQRRLASGELQRFELHARAQLDATGRTAGYLGSARRLDTDAAPSPRPAESAGDIDRRTLHALAAALPLPLFALDAPPGAAAHVAFANPAAGRLLAAEPAQLAGLAWPELRSRLPADTGQRAQTAFGASADRTPGADTKSTQSASAAQPPWEVHAERVDFDAARRSLWVLCLTPTRTSQAAATGDESFGYTVSHDLRAPIRVVDGFARILKEDYGHALDRIGNDHLDRVLGAAARMNSMIDALLALSQLSSRPLARQPVNLTQLAGYVADDLRRQAPERKVEIRIEDGLQAQGDPTLLRIALENLLGNAWKYTAKKPDARIWFERAEHDGQPAFCVRDNGAGFDMRFADRLFGVFQRLHSANDFPGTGVGLASVQRIVRRHGGEIWAESEVQRGSRFHFTLPSAPISP